MDHPPTLDKQTIKRAYKRMALKYYHPDVITNPHSSTEEKKQANDHFVKINGAYAALMETTEEGYVPPSSSSSSQSPPPGGGYPRPSRRNGNYYRQQQHSYTSYKSSEDEDDAWWKEEGFGQESTASSSKRQTTGGNTHVYQNQHSAGTNPQSQWWRRHEDYRIYK